MNDSIASLQANILLIKQTMHAQEISHNEQMKYVKDTYLKIKTDILSCAQLTNTVITVIINSSYD
jgi:hypothetical protein